MLTTLKVPGSNMKKLHCRTFTRLLATWIKFGLELDHKSVFANSTNRCWPLEMPDSNVKELHCGMGRSPFSY